MYQIKILNTVSHLYVILIDLENIFMCCIYVFFISAIHGSSNCGPQFGFQGGEPRLMERVSEKNIQVPSIFKI